jgi:AraC-like DNA-binding protein
VGAGQFTIYELSAPFTYSHADPTDVIVVKLPMQLLSARVGKVGAVLGQSYFARTGIGRLTAEFLGGIAREANVLPHDAKAAFGHQVVDLVGLMLDCNGDRLPIAHSATKSALYRRCLALIRSRLGDPDLDPLSAAAAVGISPRYLHRVFQEAGKSFGGVLQDERLERSRRDLCDPGKMTLSIGEVASRAGFRSQSHFFDLFRKKFGASPGALRRAAKQQDA